MISFAVIGAAWRAEFFAKLALHFPEKFELQATLVRDEDKDRAWENIWKTLSYRDLESLLTACNPDFIITSVPRDVNASFVEDLSDRGIPVLSETPPGATIEEMNNLFSRVQDTKGQVQVAEQYFLRP